jgi:hypothetical protein
VIRQSVTSFKGKDTLSLNAAPTIPSTTLLTAIKVAPENFFMAIDSFCQLHIFEGTFECNEVDIDKEIWSSDKYGPWEIEDVLYNGQIYHGLV